MKFIWKWWLIGLLIEFQTVRALYSASSDVVLLTPQNFESVVLSSKHLAVVEFFAPWCGHCKNLAPEYEKVANTLKGLARVGAVDCDQPSNQLLCSKYEIKGFPTIKLFSKTEQSHQPVISDYQGPRTAGALAGTVIQKLPSFVTPVVGNQITTFLKQASSPTAILITSKKETPPLWKGLSAEFQGRMWFGEGKDTDQTLMAHFKISQVPAILVVPSSTTKTQEPKVYYGEMKYTRVVSFLESCLPSRSEDPSSSPMASHVQEEAKTSHLLPIYRQSELEEHCLHKESGLCGIFLTRPHTSTSPMERNLMERVSQHFTARNIRFVWLDGTAHDYLLAKLKDVSNQLPSLLVVHPHKRTYTGYQGDFTETALIEGIDDILLGGGRRLRYTQFPRLNV